MHSIQNHKQQFIFTKNIYLKGKAIQIFHLWIHSPNSSSGWSWVDGIQQPEQSGFLKWRPNYASQGPSRELGRRILGLWCRMQESPPEALLQLQTPALIISPSTVCLYYIVGYTMKLQIIIEINAKLNLRNDAPCPFFKIDLFTWKPELERERKWKWTNLISSALLPKWPE